MTYLECYEIKNTHHIKKITINYASKADQKLNENETKFFKQFKCFLKKLQNPCKKIFFFLYSVIYWGI